MHQGETVAVHILPIFQSTSENILLQRKPIALVVVLLGCFFNFGGLSAEEEVAEEGFAVVNVVCCVVFLALGEVVRVEGGVGGESEVVDVTVEEE